MATLAICVVGSRTILLNVQPHGQFATGLVLVLAWWPKCFLAALPVSCAQYGATDAQTNWKGITQRRTRKSQRRIRQIAD